MQNIERTLSIIKPDAVRACRIGSIMSMIEAHGFLSVAQKRVFLSDEEAKHFYKVHETRPFYKDLVSFMTSGPCFVQVLSKENAIVEYRTLMGATDPKGAEKGSIRALHGSTIQDNAVHGSDSLENAASEVAFFFAEIELMRSSASPTQ